MDRLDRTVNRVLEILAQIGFGCLILLMCLVMLNVVLRPLGHSILSTFEAVQLLSSITISFALAYATLKLTHPSMDMLVSHFSKATRRKLNITALVLSLMLWIPITWYSFTYACEQALIKESTVIAQFPIYPFRFIFVFGALLCCLLMVYNIIKEIKGGKVDV